MKMQGKWVGKWVGEWVGGWWVNRRNRYHQLHEAGCDGVILRTLLWGLIVAAVYATVHKAMEGRGDLEAYSHIPDS